MRGVINCTGLGASKFVGDPHLFPTKGQSVIVRGQAHRISTGFGDGWEDVVVPRYGENETFLGVSKVAHDGYVQFLPSVMVSLSKGCVSLNRSLHADESVTQTILRRCKALAPELLNDEGEFEVLSVQVGLRPTRIGGARVEVEEYSDEEETVHKFVCHNYGHHGAGYVCVSLLQ